ncbi:MAG: hypothetical protein ACUVTE_02240 [Candidatus Bathycorpusculaceae bacterium]
MFNVLIPALAILAVLSVIGISRPRKMRLSTWCWMYISIAISFDVLTFVAVVFRNTQLIEILLGIAAGSATSLAYHVWKDMRETEHHKE